MAAPLEKQAEQLLLAGESKKAIMVRLATDENRARLLAILNNKALLSRRHRYLWVNLALAGALLFVTLKRLLAISAAGHFDFYLLADFIVPTINFYVLREILRFQRIGYQLLSVLTTLALIYPANRVLPDLIIHLGIIGASLALHRQLFPRSELLTDSSKE
jgi:hypothetical protein